MALNNEDKQPNAYRVEDDDNIEEKDLRRTTFMFGTEEKNGEEPGMEGNPAGGQRFGENSSTPSGDDKNNPSQNAGYSNEYFRRTEPLDEHPENVNFKDANQLGQSNYSEANGSVATGQSDEENGGPKEDTSEDNKHEQNLSFQESTTDNDGANHQDDVGAAGYGELPEQQKVGGAHDESDDNNKPVAD